eukprot:c24906_g6_i1 orf=901-4083(+)
MMAIVERQCASLDLMDPLSSVEEYMGILQTCRKNKNLSYANRLHVQICSNGLEVHVALGNHLVPLFVDCGSLSQAQQIFYKIDHRNEHAWTSLIVGFVECEAVEDAFNLFESMCADGIQPSGHTYLALLKACTKLDCTEQGHCIHTEITKGGFDMDAFVANALVDMHVKCGSLLEARSVFDMLPARDIVSWNALMTGYADHELGDDVLRLFEQMQGEGIAPNERTYVCLLRSCASVGAANKGQELHDEIAREGLDSNMYIGSALVGMYAKCGFLKEARDVFDELLVQDVILWTTLISGYGEYGLGNEACKCLEEMQYAGVSPNCVTWVSGLKACHTVGLVDKGRAIHQEIVKRSLETATGSNLVEFYAECGLLVEARQVLMSLPVQDAKSWTALISGYVEHGLGDEAILCLKEMEESVTLNSFMLACIIRACGSIRALDTGQIYHAKVIQEGFEGNVIMCNNLIEMYVNCNALTEAEDVLDDLLDRDVVSWSALITGYVEHGSAEEALNCFRQMQLEGLSPDAVTFVGILRACGTLQALYTGQEVHSHITVAGFKEDVHIGNSLIDMYAKCGSFDEARQVFDRLCPMHDVVSWNALITGYFEKGMNMEALNCLLEMYSKGVLANHTTYTCCLKAFGSLGAIDEGQVLHAEIVRRGFDKHPLVGNSLVDLYLKCSLDEEAREVFDNLPLKDVVSWNRLVTGYADHGRGKDALNCLKEMRSQGVAPNAITYVESLRSCGSFGALSKGLELHGEIVKEEFDTDPFINNSLVGMYAKCGSLLEAQDVFDKLLVWDVVSWNALILGYAEHKRTEEALFFFVRMQLEGFCPDIATLVCVLKACSGSGAANRGQEIHGVIVKHGLLEKDLVVGTGLVDMYANLGMLIEAQAVFDKLPVRNVVTWSALMEGYAQLGKDEIVLDLFDKMIGEGMEPDSVTFTILLNICSHRGLLDEGQTYFEIVTRDYGIIPTLDHITCMVDLFGRAGHFDKVVAVMEEMPFSVTLALWQTLLGACRKWGSTKLGRWAFEHAVEVDDEDAAAYVSMSNIYAAAGKQEVVAKIEAMKLER